MEEKALVIKKINQLPDNLTIIVSDFIDKLLQGYEIGLRDNLNLSEDEKKEILEAIAEFESKPKSGVEWNKLKSELTKNYEL